jgi:hypothetical protein
MLKQRLPDPFNAILDDRIRDFLDQLPSGRFRVEFGKGAKALTTAQLFDNAKERQVGYINRDVVKDGVLGYTFHWSGKQTNSCPIEVRRRLEQELRFRHQLEPSEYVVQRKQVNRKPGVYVVLRTAAAATKVLGAASSVNAVARWPAPPEPGPDLESLFDDLQLAATTRQALVEARLGQGQFRQHLIERFLGRCVVTGCDFQPLLRASHIKPWRLSNNQERLDPDNGLLLVANLDALFDRCLISFSDEGQLLPSPLLPQSVITLLAPTSGLLIRLSAKQRAYLRHHRDAMQALEG